MKKLIIILLLFLVNCDSYRPIYSNSNQLNIQFSEFILNGNEKINRQIINILNLDKSLSSKNQFLLTTNYSIKETSKNPKGQIDTFRSAIEAQLIIKKGDEILKIKNFSNNFSYNNKDNKYELKKYQNKIKNDLITNLSQEISLFLKLL